MRDLLYELIVPVEYACRSTALLVREQYPGTDGDESDPCDPTNDLGIHMFGDHGARENPERGSEHECRGGRREDSQFWMGRVGRVQKSGELGLVAEFGNEDGGENGCEEFEIHIGLIECKSRDRFENPIRPNQKITWFDLQIGWRASPHHSGKEAADIGYRE